MNWLITTIIVATLITLGIFTHSVIKTTKNIPDITLPSDKAIDSTY